MYMYIHNTRNCHFISMPYSRLTKVLSSFEAVGFTLLNVLPAEAHNACHVIFKTVLHKLASFKAIL